MIDLKRTAYLPICMVALLTLVSLAKRDGQESIELVADLDSNLSAMEQIKKAFGKASVECPEIYSSNHPGVEHLKVEKDKEFGSRFRFLLHRDLDGDRDRQHLPGEERQRNEIKGYEGSPPAMKAVNGDSVEYTWLLKIRSKFSINKTFCHFFQLKPVGTNDEYPIATLSGALTNGNPQLEFRTFGEEEKRYRIADWRDCINKWLICRCQVEYSERGKVFFSVKSTEGSIDFSHLIESFPSWKNDYSFIRPKWGIYRSLVDKKSIVNEEDSIFLNRIKVQKQSL